MSNRDFYGNHFDGSRDNTFTTGVCAPSILLARGHGVFLSVIDKRSRTGWVNRHACTHVTPKRARKIAYAILAAAAKAEAASA